MRFVRSEPVDLTRWSKAVENAYPPPPEPSTAAAAANDQAKIASDVFHVEVDPAGDSRDLAIRKLSDASQSRTGSLILFGARAEAHVISGGSTAAEQLPATLKLAPGKYEIRTVEKSQVLWSQSVEVEAFKTITVTVGGKK
jgi:hypothetical protein